jgi:hypothetical protein
VAAAAAAELEHAASLSSLVPRPEAEGGRRRMEIEAKLNTTAAPDQRLGMQAKG